MEVYGLRLVWRLGKWAGVARVGVGAGGLEREHDTGLCGFRHAQTLPNNATRHAHAHTSYPYSYPYPKLNTPALHCLTLHRSARPWACGAPSSAAAARWRRTWTTSTRRWGCRCSTAGGCRRRRPCWRAAARWRGRCGTAAAVVSKHTRAPSDPALHQHPKPSALSRKSATPPPSHTSRTPTTPRLFPYGIGSELTPPPLPHHPYPTEHPRQCGCAHPRHAAAGGGPRVPGAAAGGAAGAGAGARPGGHARLLARPGRQCQGVPGRRRLV